MSFNSKKNFVNYLYFGLVLAAICLFSLFYFLSQPLSWSSAYFSLYAVLQALLETSLFLLIASWLKAYAPKWTFYLFVGLTFIALLAHYTDFIMLKLLDTSVSYVFKFLFGSGIEHMKVGFLALNLNPIMVAMIVASLVLIPLLGMAVYKLTEKWSHLKSWEVSLGKLAFTTLTIALTLLIFDYFASFSMSCPIHRKYQKALPFGSTFFAPKGVYYRLPKELSPLPEEKGVQEYVSHLTPLQKPLPNIYLFIIETFRRDFVTDEVAPNLASFMRENMTFDKTYSNATYTSLSWVALLHADFPYRWTNIRDERSEGGVPLQILKKLGYQIRVYSSADLRYFQIDQVLFGKNRKLLDHVEEYTMNREITPAERDALAISSFEKDLEKHKSGNVFLFFLDSTHSEYSFPKDEPLKFTPISDEISYLTMSPGSSALEKLKNRYRNSVHYVDSLLQRFFTRLKEENVYEEAIIAITGDHAEEFFEEGALFHGTRLNHYQTNVPLVCKFPEKKAVDTDRTHMTHIDLFPSILHYLTQNTSFNPFVDGRSVFEANDWPYRICVLQNGANAPLEFTLENEEEKISARLVSSEEVEILEASPQAKFQEAFEGMLR